MSICSNSFRALSRSHVPTSKTLAPFLYHTATIQQWKLPVLPSARRTLSSRSNRDNDIPFEDDVLPPSTGEAKPARQTTITGSERAAFEKLYKKFNNSTRPPRSHTHDETDQIADEYYEEDDDNGPSAASLDTLFDAVLSRKQRSSKNKPKVRRGKTGDDLATLAAEILRPEVDRTRNKPKGEAMANAARIKKLKDEERARVKALLEDAETDRELWEVLEREVFGVIRSMDLDKPKETDKKRKIKVHQRNDPPFTPQISSTTYPTNASNARPLSDPVRHEPAIVFPNVSFYVIVAAQTLRTNFPSSPLPLSIIPTLKSLGRSSYALGATTQLYKILLRTAWLQHHSYTQITSLLQDMDNGGIECDYGILNMLDEIIAEYRMARSGKLGRGMQVVLGLEQFEEGIKRLRAWRETVAKRLGVWRESRVQQGQVVRKIGRGKTEAAPNGPKDELMVRNTALGVSGIAAPDDIPLVEDPVEHAGIEIKHDPAVDAMLKDDEVDQEPGMPEPVPEAQKDLKSCSFSSGLV